MANQGSLTKCAHTACQCTIYQDKAVHKNGQSYCSQDCADGKGCHHPHCNCGH